MTPKVLAFIPAIFLIVVGGIWTAQANGWIGDTEPSKGFATLGSIMAGLGIALLYVIVQSLRHSKR